MFARTLLKHAVFTFTRHSGVNRLLRARARRNLLVLGYHGVISEDHPGDPRRCRATVTVGEFREQLETIRRFFNPVSASDVMDWLAGGASLPAHPILVTFDDGFRNNLTHAAPELERFGVPAMIHVATAYVGRRELLWFHELDERILGWRCRTLPMPHAEPDIPMPGDLDARARVSERVVNYCKRLPSRTRAEYLNCLRNEPMPYGPSWCREVYELLTWDEIRALSRRGFAIGSHTVSHPVLTTLCGDELRREWRESKARIEEEVEEECPWIAYPNGGYNDVSEDVISAVAEAGYRVGFTLMDRGNPECVDPLRIDRVCMVPNLSPNAFQARISGLRSTPTCETS